MLAKDEPVEEKQENEPLLCSNCFSDEGLKIDAMKHGLDQEGECPNCKTSDGKKLTRDLVGYIAWRFFVSGTTIRQDYGAYPIIQFNEMHYGESDKSIPFSSWLKEDIRLIEDAVKIGFFRYSPRFWMFGEVEPLKELQDPATRPNIIERVLREYSESIIPAETKFYRLRLEPDNPSNPMEYDSPPDEFLGRGRLDSPGHPVMYGSQDIDICIHECRATADDNIFVATLKTQRDMRLLDLTEVLEEDGTEFDSLDMAIHMLFLAKKHSYEISRDIAVAAKKAGYDGIIYPSFFSLTRTGAHPFETTYGISLRRFHPRKKEYAEASTIQNFALFNRPIEDRSISVSCINRLVIKQVGYSGHFGPVDY